MKILLKQNKHIRSSVAKQKTLFRAFSYSSFKNNFQNKVKNFISKLFYFFVNKIVPTSINENVTQFFQSYREYERQVQLETSPISMYLKVLIIPGLLFTLSHFLMILYAIETNLLGVSLNEQIFAIISYPGLSAEFISFASTTTFFFMLFRFPQQLNDVKRIFKNFREEENQMKKSGIVMTKMQKRAMFTSAGKVGGKAIIAACLTCGGAIVGADNVSEKLFDYTPFSEISRVGRGVITSDQYFSHLKNHSKYIEIRNDYGISPTEADFLSDRFLKGKIKPGSSDFEKVSDIASRIDFVHKNKKN